MKYNQVITYKVYQLIGFKVKMNVHGPFKVFKEKK